MNLGFRGAIEMPPVHPGFVARRLPPVTRGGKGGWHGETEDSACGLSHPSGLAIGPAPSPPPAPPYQGGETLLEVRHNKTTCNLTSNPLGRGRLFNTPGLETFTRSVMTTHGVARGEPGRGSITRSVMTTHGVALCAAGSGSITRRVLTTDCVPVRAPGTGCRRSWISLALMAVCVAGCDLPGRPKPADRYVPPRDERAFGVLFQTNCAGCHGADGKLGPAPPLNNKLFLALVPETELKRVIASGRAGTLMPAFAEAEGGSLTAEQVELLASGIKPRWAGAEPAPSGAPSYLLGQNHSGSGGSGDRAQGAKVFAHACASCHGDHGQGGRHGGAADGMLIGAINDRDFLVLTSDQALRRYIIAGRPDLGMPDYADPTGRPDEFRPLSAQDVTDLTALLASWRQGGPSNEKGK